MTTDQNYHNDSFNSEWSARMKLNLNKLYIHSLIRLKDACLLYYADIDFLESENDRHTDRVLDH